MSVPQGCFGLSVHTLPIVSIVTAHGRQELASSKTEHLIDLLNRRRGPWLAAAAHAAPRGGSPLRLFPSPGRRLSELSRVSDTLFYFSRDVSPFLLSLSGLEQFTPRVIGQLALEQVAPGGIVAGGSNHGFVPARHDAELASAPGELAAERGLARSQPGAAAA